MADNGSNKSDVTGTGLDRSESEQVVNAQATRNALAKQFIRWAKIGDTTPSVMNVERLEFRNTSALTVTAFDDGQNGQKIEVLGDGNTTVQDNSKIVTADGLDLDLEDGVVYGFTRFSDGKWHQSSGGAAAGAGTGVTSFNTRTGAVVPVAGDYPPSFIGAVPASHLTDADPHTQYELDANKGAASGYCPLDSTTKVPLVYLPTIPSAPPAWITYHPDTPPSSPVLFGGVAYDVEFRRDNAIPAGSTVIGSPAVAPSMVDRRLRVVSGTSASPDVKGIEWPCPSTAFTATAKLSHKLWNTTYGALGLMLRRNASGAGNFIVIYLAMNTLYSITNFEVDKYTTPTARSSAGSGINFGTRLIDPAYVRMKYDGTNISANFSFEGFEDTFTTGYFSEAATAFLGGAPGRWGIIHDNFGTGANSGYCDWVRFT